MLTSLPIKEQIETRLKADFPLIQAILGPRQVGKTTLAEQIFDRWAGPKIFASADLPSLPPLEWLRFQTEQAMQKGPGTLLVVDEIQKITNWSSQIKSFFDSVRNKIPIKILLLGSSSLFLQKGLNESLVGRFEVIPVLHWSYPLCQNAFGWDLNTYLKFGGYPGAVAFIEDEDRWRNYILHSIIEPVLGRDILGQVSIGKPALFRQSFELAINYPSQIVSYTKMLGQLQDKGNATTIQHYLNLFEASFLIRLLKKYTGSTLQTIGSPPKIIVLNPALTHAYNTVSKIDNDPRWYGLIFESVVGSALAQTPGAELYYWREGSAEVDFVLKTPKGVWGIEIKSGLKSNFTKGVNEFHKKFPSAHVEQWNFDTACKFLSGNHSPWNH